MKEKTRNAERVKKLFNLVNPDDVPEFTTYKTSVKKSL